MDDLLANIQKPPRSEIVMPLAELLRPQSLDQVVGQQHLVGEDGVIKRAMHSGTIPSLVFWGPPGCGKTTLAKLVTNECGHQFELVSAVTSGVADLKKIFAKAQFNKSNGQKTVVFVDEIHRFNRAQQDVFLPYIEDGTIILFGATTENPSFELNAALLSRCKVLTVERLATEELEQLILRAEQYKEKALALTQPARKRLCEIADGDGRYLLNLCEELFDIESKELLDVEALAKILQKRMPVYDKSQDSHYNLISALHKSLRGSDVNASLYWLARMLDGGEDPIYIIRRLVRFAVEDVGLADPNAITQTIAAKDAYQLLGTPEGELAIVQAVIYLATAPKSNAAYLAMKSSFKDAKASGSLMPPKHILNAPTNLMKEQEYGKGYKYDHDYKEGFSGQNFFPEEMERREYYQPVERGFEREIIKRLNYWGGLKEKIIKQEG